MKPQFITIEGLEGAGKSTQAETICRWLDDQNIPFIRTREPGGTEIAEHIRAIILDHHNEPMDAKAELLLVFAARQQHVEQKIKPALKKGQWVLSDRFTDATYAYQGGGRGLDIQFIAQLEQLVLASFSPDATFWFDCQAEVGLSRARARGALDRIEKEALSFFNRARNAYQARANQHPHRFVKINADQPIEAVSAEVLDALEAKYG